MSSRALIFLDFLSFFSHTPFQSPQPVSLELTFLHSQWIRNLNALACLPQNAYLCIGNGRKGSISRMSDECLITLEAAIPFYIVYQAVMRKFTLAGKAMVALGMILGEVHILVHVERDHVLERYLACLVQGYQLSVHAQG